MYGLDSFDLGFLELPLFRVELAPSLFLEQLTAESAVFDLLKDFFFECTDMLPDWEVLCDLLESVVANLRADLPSDGALFGLVRDKVPDLEMLPLPLPLAELEN